MVETLLNIYVSDKMWDKNTNEIAASVPSVHVCMFLSI